MPRGRPRTYDSADVMRRATALFRRRGYAATSIADLVAATGVNRASLYAGFGGKAGLFDAALADYVEQLSAFSPLLTAEPLGCANLVAYFEAVSGADFPGGCFAVNTIRERDVVPPESFARVEALTAAFEGAARRNLAAAQARGELSAHADVGGLVAILSALEMGLLTYRILRDDAARKPAVVAELERLLR